MSTAFITQGPALCQQLLSAESVLDAAALDKYRYLRNAYLRARRYQVYDGKPPPEEEEE